MLKFSGYPYLIRGQNCEDSFWEPIRRARVRVSAALEANVPAANNFEASPRARGRRTVTQHQAELEGLNDARTGMP
jgi:hypothetical protein